ncbi:n-terminal nucleophile aminohydrolase [Diplodia corticola]|uniref:N-terminal nucleophile aminohydrolase n=1 Tax=Diplodia corticola TaxID=236234 RepID=A0A1J9S1S6_9PEZI|nr:n-terminal nucleophile aminohydrolase [Diplodia corticola]OJD33972.1 n-terminal nucleophile aminohydrolase [Diplodia corticola]
MSSPTNTTTPTITPRIIIHGGAGNISRANLPDPSHAAYRASLRRILSLARAELAASDPPATALDVATRAVSRFEDDALFNAGRGAVFTRGGTNELEASVMVSSVGRGGYRKRGAGCMLVRRVKNPVLLAREILVRSAEGAVGEEKVGGGGAQGHVQLSGSYVEELARGWGLEMVEPGYFFTQRRWDEHVRGLEREEGAAVASSEDVEAPRVLMGDGDPSWDGKEYLPQGTVGAVVLDRFGTICAATSTGGLTNKLPGRIGDTPTFGAGYWAEEWIEDDDDDDVGEGDGSSSAAPPVYSSTIPTMSYHPAAASAAARSPMDKLSRGDIASLLSDCLPSLSPAASPSPADEKPHPPPRRHRLRHAVGMSGTGNGDSFLQVCAARTAAAIPRFSSSSSSSPHTKKFLRDGMARVAGPGGELQRSAGERWGVTGEGEGGIIGIEVVVAEGDGEEEGEGEGRRQVRSWVGYDLNCGGMFRAWVDGEGRERVAVFADEDGLEGEER